MQIQLPKTQKSLNTQYQSSTIISNNSISEIDIQKNIQKQNSHNHNKYRSDIDGLRAVAIILVVIFHAWPDLLTGGYIGVDMFFVISGYLITGIVVKQIQKNQFSYWKFYQRRIKRIFPALITVLIVVIYIAYKYLPYENIKIMARTMTASTIFSANFQVLTYQQDYFDPQIQTNPLLHLWSLGVQQQFYLFWPFFLGVSSKIQKKNRLILLFTFAIISFILNLMFFQNDSKFAFYFPFCRFWEMSIGGLLIIYKKQLQSVLIKSIMSFISLILIILTSLYITGQTQFPGYWALAPTLLTVLMIFSGEQSLVNKYILSNKLIVFIGKISYPWYLWHWPLLVFSRLLFPQGSQSIFSNIQLVILVSFGLSIITYYLIQNKIRYRKSMKTVSLLIIIMILIGLISCGIYLKQQRNQDFDENNNFEKDLIQQQLNQINNKHIQPSKKQGQKQGQKQYQKQVQINLDIVNNKQKNKSQEIVYQNPQKHNISKEVIGLPIFYLNQMMPQLQDDFYLKEGSSKVLPNSSKNKKRNSVTKEKLQKVIQYQKFNKNRLYQDKEKHINPHSSYYQKLPEGRFLSGILNEGNKNSLFVLGDSHARFISFRFQQLWHQAKQKNLLNQFPTIVSLIEIGKPFFPRQKNFDFFTNYIKKYRPKRIFFCHHWIVYLKYQDKNRPLQQQSSQWGKKKKYKPSKTDVINKFRIVAEAFKEFIDLGIEVYTVGIHPQGEQFDPSQMYDLDQLINYKLKASKLSQFRNQHKQEIQIYENAMEKVGVKIINFSDHQCWNDICQRFVPSGYSIFIDNSHYSDVYSRYWASSVDFLTQF